jgi:pSer/pThr/pTyr-binding forkhead associated (FHA) protein
VTHVEQPTIDYASLARSLEREQFIAECPFPLLLAANYAPPPDPSDPFAADTNLNAADPEPDKAAPTERAELYAVRKVHTIIPHGIILGRGSTSDIVVLDMQISKTHAMFQSVGDGWEVSDAGSRNGTWVGNQKLLARTESAALKSGDILSFGHRAFFFLDAAACWERLRGVR